MDYKIGLANGVEEVGVDGQGDRCWFGRVGGVLRLVGVTDEVDESVGLDVGPRLLGGLVE